MTRAVVLAAFLLASCGRRRFDDRPDGATSDVLTGSDDASDAASCTHTFCDDFERTTPPGTGWDAVDTQGIATGMIGSGVLAVTVPATGDRWFLVKQLPAPTTSVEIGLRMSYATTDVGANCELDLVTVNWDGNTCGSPFGYYLVRDGTDAFNLQETNGEVGCTTNRNDYGADLVNSGPHDLELVVTLGASSHVSLQVDGVPFYDMPTANVVPSSTLTLRLGGIGDRNVAAPWTITYDEIYVDVK